MVIATPDHWHALQTIHGCQAGKDVYVEKPLSLCVQEGRHMVEAARHYHRVTQVGIMRRSSTAAQEAADFIRAGGLGKVSIIRSFDIENEWPKGIGNPPDEEPPADLDWEAWLGPAPKVPYNRNRAFYKFRWFYGYSGGQVTNFGTHYLDFSHMVLGQQIPQAVTAMGAKATVEDNREIPDTLEALWMYPGGTMVAFSQYNANSAPADLHKSTVEVRGTKGTLYLSWWDFEIVPQEVSDGESPVRNPLDRDPVEGWDVNRHPAMEPRKVDGNDSTTAHARNFLDCVRSRKPCVCDIEIGHRSTTATLLANIALKTKSYLEWDGAKERFTNNDAANRYLNYEYRAPYKLPKIG